LLIDVHQIFIVCSHTADICIEIYFGQFTSYVVILARLNMHALINCWKNVRIVVALYLPHV